MAILNQEEPAHAAAAVRLRTEPIMWLTTVARSGQPQSTPVWFLWEAGEFLIYGLANGPKTRNIGSNPYVSLHLEGNGRGGANVIFEGTARIDPVGPRADAVPAYIEKYREFIDAYGWTPESFATDYPYVIRVSPTRARIWLPRVRRPSRRCRTRARKAEVSGRSPGQSVRQVLAVAGS